MNRKYLIVALSLFIFNNGFAQKKNYQVSAVAFYNLENFFDTEDDPNKADEEFTPNGAYHYTNEIFQQKAHNLATVISKFATDVIPDGPALIGVAEVENDKALSALINQPELKDRHYKYVWYYGPDERGISTGMIYNPKYFTVISSEPIHVNLGGSGGKETTRDILHVCGVLLGDTVHVLVNHWPSRRGGEVTSAPKRAIAARMDKKVIDSLQHINPAAKIIMMGDLNDNPTDVSMTKVLGATGDKEKVKINGLYNPWVAFYKQGTGTESFDDSWNLFDQIVVSGGLMQKTDNGWYYYKAEVFKRDFMIEKFGQYKGNPHRSFAGNTWIDGYSDHYPTIVYFIREVK